MKKSLAYYRNIFEQAGVPFHRTIFNSFSIFLSKVEELSLESPTQLIKPPEFSLTPQDLAVGLQEEAKAALAMMETQAEKAQKSPEAKAKTKVTKVKTKKNQKSKALKSKAKISARKDSKSKSVKKRADLDE